MVGSTAPLTRPGLPLRGFSLLGLVTLLQILAESRCHTGWHCVKLNILWWAFLLYRTVFHNGKWGWCCDERTHLPPMWLGVGPAQCHLNIFMWKSILFNLACLLCFQVSASCTSHLCWLPWSHISNTDLWNIQSCNVENCSTTEELCTAFDWCYGRVLLNVAGRLNCQVCFPYHLYQFCFPQW